MSLINDGINWIKTNDEGIPVTKVLEELTWADKPTAAEFGRGQAWFSDIGINGSMWYSNGVTWVPESKLILQNTNKGWIVPSMAAANAATYSQSGTTLTVTCAAHTMITALNGADIYLAIGTPATGVAPTAPVYANWFQNFQYVDANTFTCVAGNSQTGTGAINTNTSDTYVLELEQTVLGGLLGLNGSLTTSCSVSRSGDASTKLIKQLYHTVTYHTPTRTTGSQSERWYAELNTQNSSNFITYPNALYSGYERSAGTYGRSSIDTTVDRQHKVVINSNAALAYQAIMQWRLEVVR